MVFNSVSISSQIIYLEYMFVNFDMYWIVKSFTYHPDILTNLSSADHPCETTFSRPSAKMICLVEGFEGVNLGTGKVGDYELSKNEVCGARASSLKTKHENPALNLSRSASPTCCRKRTDRFLQRVFPPKTMSQDRYQIFGDQRRYRENMKINCDMPRPSARSSMHVWFPIVIF